MSGPARRRPSSLLPVILGVATAAGLVVTGVPASVAASPQSAPALAPVAPYLELSGPNGDNLRGGLDTGLRSVTAAFVIGRGCIPTWDDRVPVTKDKSAARAIHQAQASGGQVIVSFGGAGGTELARSCTDLGRLTAAYTDVIDRFGVTEIDFDIEGDSIDPKAEKASIARRFAAVRALEQAMPDLVVSVTVPVGPTGLVSSGLKLLRTAERSGTPVDLVNIMTMDYGGAVADMGGTAINAAQATLGQLQSIWPDDTYANLGVTPMIGDNDSADETFTLADATEVTAFAADSGIGRLAFWSLNRDQQCGSQDSPRGDCSGVSQQPLEFTTTFLGG